MELPGLGRLEELTSSAFLDIKSLADGGIIVQKSFVNRILEAGDFLPATATTKDGLSVSARAPSKQELDDLRFAWAVEAGVTSNSVIFVRDGATLAIGTGEQDRVGCVELAIHKAHTKYADTLAFRELGLSLYELKEKAATDADMAAKLADIESRTEASHGGLAGSALVSDGFFPFRDGVDVAVAQGVAAIAQPGGSMQRIGASVKPDEHILVSLDGYRLHIGPSLTTWVELPEDRQKRLSEEFGGAAFAQAACQAMLQREPLWLDGWLLLAAHHEQRGDLAAATATLLECLGIMPAPKVCAQLSRLDPQAVFEGTRVDAATAKIRVQQARRAAYSRGDTALAQLLGEWLVQYAA